MHCLDECPGLGGSGSELKKSIVVGIVLVRYVALPVTGILIVRGAAKFGWVGSDPLYLFVLLLQFAVPPAMNIGKKYSACSLHNFDCELCFF